MRRGSAQPKTKHRTRYGIEFDCPAEIESLRQSRKTAKRSSRLSSSGGRSKDRIRAMAMEGEGRGEVSADSTQEGSQSDRSTPDGYSSEESGRDDDEYVPAPSVEVSASTEGVETNA